MKYVVKDDSRKPVQWCLDGDPKKTVLCHQGLHLRNGRGIWRVVNIVPEKDAVLLSLVLDIMGIQVPEEPVLALVPVAEMHLFRPTLRPKSFDGTGPKDLYTRVANDDEL